MKKKSILMMSKNAEPLYGLVLAGGESSRMNSDKALLNYFGKPQYERIYELLQPFCEQVFISGKESQTYHLPVITDHQNYESWGPLAGLMTAYDMLPGNWIVVAIDYPLIQESDIQLLINQRDDTYDATVYFDYENQFFEPFIGVYEKQILQFMKEQAVNYKYSAQKLLHQRMVKKATPINNEILQSIDTPEAMEKIQLKLKL